MQACLRSSAVSGPRLLPKSPVCFSRIATAGTCEVRQTFFRHSDHRSGAQYLKKVFPVSRGNDSFSVKASATDMATSTQKTSSTVSPVVEHIVLIKVKESVSAETKEAMFELLRGLKSLDGVLHLSAGPVLNVEGADFTHVLHGRYKDKEALTAYAKHPEHVNILKNYVVPNATDILALDWECQPSNDFREGCTAGRVTLMKVKEGARDEDIKALVGTAYDLPARFPGAWQVSAGPNFAPARAKGYNYGFLTFFENTKEADVLHSSNEHKTWQEKAVTALVDSLIVVDYQL